MNEYEITLLFHIVQSEVFGQVQYGQVPNMHCKLRLASQL